MIQDSFDKEGEGIISPAHTVRKMAAFVPDDMHTFILTFSHKLVDHLLAEGIVERIDEHVELGSASMKAPVLRINGTKIGVLLTITGAATTAATVEELHALFGVEKLILFGSCGALTDLPAGRLIVPDAAYRDEGTSYHYAEPADYIEIPGSRCLQEILEAEGIPYASGRTWTTDAFYRETVRNKEARIREGCICVEMECAAVQAVCSFRGIGFYPFLYAADSLTGSWQNRILGNMEMDSRVVMFRTAQMIAEKLTAAKA